MIRITTLSGLFLPTLLAAQAGYWQQHVDYRMEVDLNHNNHLLTGEQWLSYTNHSPDTIDEVFYYLYFNAFQPNSMMDVHSGNISDPDKRVGNRIAGLDLSEVGYCQISLLEQGDKMLNFHVNGTVLKAELKEPLAPGDSTVLHLAFNSQVPVQIRRSGRNNSEDIDYSMTQWYPKLAVYDEDGWHVDPYIGREFYGNYGRFDVKITIDKSYLIGGTGILMNAAEIGKGYMPEPDSLPERLTWHFTAENVHDFAWAADPDFEHKIVKMEDGPDFHLIYHRETAYEKNWLRLQEMAPKFFRFMNEHFGEYPYPQFTVIQGGDGGMEYPMSTLMLGSGEDWEGFFGLFVHEATHNWYYGVIGTNESAYPWMDEGFTTFAEDECLTVLLHLDTTKTHAKTYDVYRRYVQSGTQDPMRTHADHFEYNRSYAVSSYYMGSVFLNQLRYVIGEEAFWKGMKRYYKVWKFKHPKPEDFLRIMEKESGMILDWYLNYWVDLTQPIDYAIDTVLPVGFSKSRIVLENRGGMPMPADLRITLKGGSQMEYSIPLVMMQGHKKGFSPAAPWPWTHPIYDLEIDFEPAMIERIEIDAHHRSADINRKNNVYPIKK